MTRVIITGGTGLIGRRLVPLLSRNGYEVYVLTRNPLRRREALRHLPPNVHLHAWDALTPEGWSHLINADTVIINLAGQNVAHWRWTATHRRVVLQSRLDATRAVVQAVAAAPQKPRAVHQASAVGYYGTRGELAIGEITTPGTGWRAEVCKLWEAESDPLEALGVRRVLLRIGIVLERGGGALPAMALGVRMMGGQLGDGRQWVPWIHNADVADAILHLITHEDIHGGVNVVAPYPATNREFMAALGRVWGWPSFVPVPAWALHFALGEMATSVLDSQRVYAPILTESGYQFRFPQIDEALRDLLRHQR